MPLKLNKKDISKQGTKDNSVAKQNFPKLPSPIPKPTAEELRTMYYELKNKKIEKHPPKIVALNDDWRTQGDWIDRYGRYAGVLCAQAGGGFNFYTGYHLVEMQSVGWIGRNYRQKGDSLRNWVHWIESNDKRVLQCENLGGRKQAEWDDHKEVYPITLDGPHIYGTFKLPAGQYLMSFYFFNKDGHQGHNRLRDYVLSVKTMPLPKEIFEKLDKNGINAEKEFFQAKEWDHVRIKDFWGGVYKRFYVEVHNNEYITFRLDSCFSFNTIISGVFFDPVGELKSLNYGSPPPKPREPTQWAEVLDNPTEPWWWKINTIDMLLCQRDQNPMWFYQYSRQKLLTVTRAVVNLENKIPHAPLELDANDKKRIRPDVGKIVNALQLFDIADRIDFTKEKYKSYRWQDRNTLGRKKARESDWDWKEFYKFSEQGIAKETW
jgi:hypothetical protein